VISYIVAQRSREIGIRLALGAQPPALERTFVQNGSLSLRLGIAAGLVAAAAI
jgi:ABC-type lipoprotein release transport system permease subunit